MAGLGEMLLGLVLVAVAGLAMVVRSLWTTAYPAALDTFTNPTGGQVQGSTTPTHAGHHANVNDAIEAIEAKLGIGADIAAANEVLRGIGAGQTAFGQIVGLDITSGTIGSSHLANDSVATAALQNLAVTAAKIANDTITATQIAADAIGASELADNAVATANIVANAVSAYQRVDVSAAGGTSTTPVILTGTAISFSAVGGKLLLMVQGTIRNSLAANDTSVAFFIDGAQVGADMIVTASGNSYGGVVGGVVATTVAAGTRSCELRYRVSSGTASITLAFTVLELRA